MTRKFMISCSINLMLPTIFSLYTFFLCSSVLYCSARDTITNDNSISDGRETLVSAGEIFELGFFTPNGSLSKARYVGIWYYNFTPQTVVWVANRDDPVLNNGGVFALTEEGNLMVSDRKRKLYWSAKPQSSSSKLTAKLMDSGNLILSDDASAEIQWESFSHPTDTFLPGMKMDETLQLTSWESSENPATGSFTFQRDQEGVRDQFIIRKKLRLYWKSMESENFTCSDQMFDTIADLLSNFSRKCSTETSYRAFLPPQDSDYRNRRLVMNFTGEIQYQKFDNKNGWSSNWSAPIDQCDVLNACGNFGSCNINNGLVCKCLPGFEPSYPDNWDGGDFTGGCVRKLKLCSKSGQNDTFLSLKMMKVRNTGIRSDATSENKCRQECHDYCHCQAYSYDTRADVCWTWTDDLSNLQEEYATGGRDLSVRVDLSDIESTRRNCEICGTNIIPYPLSTGINCGDPMYYLTFKHSMFAESTVRDCEPCGTNMIPYPLSTGKNCGDPMYYFFYCNTSTGQVSFLAPGSTYRVTGIIPKERKFVIEVKDEEICEARNIGGKSLQLNLYPKFQWIDWQCNASQANSIPHMLPPRRDEILISWDPPPEPPCSSSRDCKDWPNSTCNTAEDKQKRCLCNANFQWNNSSLNCTQVPKAGYNKQFEGHSSRKMSETRIIVVSITAVIVLIALSCAVVYISYLKRRKVTERQENRENIQRNQALHLYNSERRLKEFMDSDQFGEEDKKGIDVPIFDFGSILVATDNFSDTNKLGKGGFGPVYKGKFSGGREIAVKRLSSASGQGLEEFKNEVVLIAKLQHRNLVRLLGYCIEGEEKILLYEYMPNKSLDSFIFDQKLCAQLDWELRFNIIMGIARGLLYLHQDSRLRIIHRDLKTSNILLDEEMNPKISDFGLARIFGGKQIEAATSKVVGTYGYMSPEYANYGFFSVKSDVFSFGVVVLEIISGKRITRFYQAEQTLSLLGYAWRLWNEDKALNLMDQTLCETCDTNEFLKCINVGLLCVQEDAGDRPTMSNVVFMLGSETATLPTPKQPAFIVRKDPSSIASSSTRPETWSHNELTTTMEEGR